MLYGDGNIQDVLCGVKVTLSPHSFYQVNREGAENLYTIAKNALQLNKDDILLDRIRFTDKFSRSFQLQISLLRSK